MAVFRASPIYTISLNSLESFVLVPKPDIDIVHRKPQLILLLRAISSTKFRECPVVLITLCILKTLIDLTSPSSRSPQPFKLGHQLYVATTHVSKNLHLRKLALSSLLHCPIQVRALHVTARRKKRRERARWHSSRRPNPSRISPRNRKHRSRCAALTVARMAVWIRASGGSGSEEALTSAKNIMRGFRSVAPERRRDVHAVGPCFGNRTRVSLDARIELTVEPILVRSDARHAPRFSIPRELCVLPQLREIVDAAQRIPPTVE
mmetsp:Transcript_13575/g.29413  ORF Transcript_13575/g.29413 Transcript_13575/m.29413 type:complete len:264 (+) Transcript_13575:540-1331(+)